MTLKRNNLSLALLLSAILVIAVLVVNAATSVPAKNVRTFGHIISAAKLGSAETELYNYSVVGQQGAAVTHWWFTGTPNIDNLRMRFYIDGETTPSIDIPLDLAAGIGFDDDAAPWGSELIGKGAQTGGVFNNIRIPFFKSIRITCQQPANSPQATYWWIVRGAEGILPINIGNVELPTTAKLRVYTIANTTYNPLDIISVATVHNKGGALMMWTLAVASGNLNFLEGCVRCFIDNGPQILLSSGTEDYFDSAFYFDSGPYRLPVSGLTHIQTKPGAFGTQFSAYRFHTTDPVIWQNSFVLNWRNGDTYNPTNGQKCIDDNGKTWGNPQRSQVTSYVWLYEF